MMTTRRPPIARALSLALAVAAGIAAGPARDARAQDPKGPAPKQGEAPPAKAGEAAPKPFLPPKPPPPDEPLPADGGPRAFMATTDQAILFYQGRSARDPADFASPRILAELYERKAKETGDLTWLAKAEAAVRQSLDRNPTHPRGRATLAAILCARHKFAEGLEVASKLHREDPKDLDALSTMGDALMESGRYEEAEAAYRDLHGRAPVPEALARLANLAEVKGKPDEAAKLLRQAIEALRKYELPKADAWYQARLGDVTFNAGRLDEAEAAYRAVPGGVDPYHDATFGLGRILAARGRTAEAIEQVKKAVAIGPDLHMLALLGDLYARAGDADKAEAAYRRLEQEAPRQAEHGRDLALFYADHDRQLPRALELTRKEFAARRDVFTRDALAWALLKNGQAEEAARTIAEALAQGIQDARVYYHAGMIHRALGDKDRARDYLGKALALNPHFSVIQADGARKALDELGAGASTSPP